MLSVSWLSRSSHGQSKDLSAKPLILDRPYLAGFRNEHREYQASIGDLVAAEIVDFDNENVTRLLITIESSRLQFLWPGNGSLHNLYHSAYFEPYF
jgi:hypothetical protein